jgi:arginyl-tRNA synthetase
MKELKMKDLKKEEKGLVKVLADFPNVVEQAAKEMRINLVCNYAYELATVFSTFYQFCPVLKAGSEQQKGFRLALVAATKVVLKNSLSLLGIEAMEKM